MNAATDQLIDLIFGRWFSQILSACTELGVFDHLRKCRAKTAKMLAAELGADLSLLYRWPTPSWRITLVQFNGRSAWP